MKCIYEIRYEVQWDDGDPSRWESRSVRVLSDADALDAVHKVRDVILAKGWLDDNGVEHHCQHFRLREVTLVAEAEM